MGVHLCVSSVQNAAAYARTRILVDTIRDDSALEVDNLKHEVERRVERVEERLHALNIFAEHFQRDLDHLDSILTQVCNEFCKGRGRTGRGRWAEWDGN